MNQLVFRWLVGLVVGTALIAISSPLFVRSYVPRELDSLRQVTVYQPGVTYRWRNEGYATTRMGPHGMPGQIRLADSPEIGMQLALWGDSQAEGVAVKDRDKLFAQTERLRFRESQRLDSGDVVYPFARSGEDASIWLPQLRRVEQALGVDAHVMLIVDLEDLFAVPPADAERQESEGPSERMVQWSSQLPAFVVHAAVQMFRNVDNTGWRKLRWSVGPEAGPGKFSREESSLELARPNGPGNLQNETLLGDCVARLSQFTDKPLLIVFAPRRPEIVDGIVVELPEQMTRRVELQQRLTRAGIDWVDMTEAFSNAAEANEWPHGFHNGQIGVGHLNERGYRLIAQEVNAWWNQISERVSR